MSALEKVTNGVKAFTELSVCLLALAVVLQILFGAAVPFFPVDVVGGIVALTKSLGSEGLVGLVALGVLHGIFSRGLAGKA
tara:strand:+ start:24003 stop:24245 length:243 start_codon:yes stop_codon:yes gene_type:complete